MTDLIDTLMLPFMFPFMQQAFVIGLLVAIPTALLSSYLVLKGWSLMGDAVSHAVLPGVVLAYMVGLPLGVGAFIAGMFAAVATGFLSENSRVKEDTVLGIVFSGMFGLGIVLYTQIQTDVHLDHILFGNILGVDWADILQTGVIALVVLIAVAVKGRDLLLYVFDPHQAAASGLPVRWLHYGTLAILSLSIVSALKAAGIILAVALLVSPGAIAFLITRRFQMMQLAAVAIAAGSSFLGIYLSFFINSAPAPTIVLVMALLFVLVFVMNRISVARAMRKTVLAA